MEKNILLPVIAKLLGHPLEDYGVSIVKYDNSGSWKRFARLFLRSGKDDEAECDKWYPVKVAVLRDLDLWPDCAEEKDENPYGFKKRKVGNANNWLGNVDRDTVVEGYKGGLERQNILIKISDDWTFEYCLAKHGLFEQCVEALKKDQPQFVSPEGTVDERATGVLQKTDKTDFAYALADLLEKSLQDKIDNRGETGEEEVKATFANDLRANLPPYIVSAFDYLVGGAEAVDAAEVENA